MVAHTRQPCDEMYEVIIKELESMCPKTSFTDLSHTRVTRELFTLFAILLITVVACVGFNVTFVQTSTLNTELTTVKNQLRETELFVEQKAPQLNQAKVAINLLNSNFQNLTTVVVKIDEDHIELKRTLISSSFAIFYITARLLLGQNILRRTVCDWKNRKLHEPFFDYLNFTLFAKMHVLCSTGHNLRFHFQLTNKNCT